MQIPKELQRILTDRTREVFDRNRVKVRGLEFHQPALGSYESIYAWDSGWNMIAASAFDPERGIRELESLFRFQFDDGRIPHESRLKELGGSENLERRIYIRLVRSQFDPEGRSRMIDPPSYLIAAGRLYGKTRDPRILNLLPAMKRCLDYLTGPRDVAGDGLVAQLHPWECGCDMAPYFDVMTDVNIRKPGWVLRYELSYMKTMKRLGRIDWDPREVRRRKQFFFEDAGFNGLTAAGALELAGLFRASGKEDLAADCEQRARKIIRACEAHLWDEERGFFYPRWNSHGWVHQNPAKSFRTCINGIAPLVSGLVEPVRAERVIREFLESPGHFAAPRGVSFNSLKELDHTVFRRQPLWRGPCQWICMNWIAAEAASRYGHLDLARKITIDTAGLIAERGFREYYDPRTGEGGGASGFTWPGLIVDMMERHGDR